MSRVQCTCNTFSSCSCLKMGGPVCQGVDAKLHTNRKPLLTIHSGKRHEVLCGNMLRYLRSAWTTKRFIVLAHVVDASHKTPGSGGEFGRSSTMNATIAIRKLPEAQGFMQCSEMRTRFTPNTDNVSPCTPQSTHSVQLMIESEGGVGGGSRAGNSEPERLVGRVLQQPGLACL